MDNITENLPGANNADKKERVYDILAVISRILIGVFAFGILFYFISATISWRVDVSSAKKEVGIVKYTLSHYKTQPYPDTALTSIGNKINDTLYKHKLPLIDISNFVFKDTLYTTSLGDVNDLEAIRGKSSWFRSEIDSSIVKYTKNFSGIDFYQFITQGAFTTNFQVNAIIILFVLLSIILLFNGVYYYHIIKRKREEMREQQALQEEIKSKSNASPVWELAQITLDKYYSRNLVQNNWIFYASVAVMVAGFCLVLYGIAAAYSAPDSRLVTIASTGSGIIVQFIGATFLVIYNSTITQAIQYTNSLQNVSTIGTSIKILDSIKDEETDEMKNDKKYIQSIIDAKIEIAKLLIEKSKTEQRPSNKKK